MNPETFTTVVSSGSGDNDLRNKKASFIQHSLPALEAGQYQIQVGQALHQSNGQDITGGLPTLTRKFGVTGPKYSLSPDVIHSVFPPANTAGEFSNSLAHVVLNAEKLPWLRSPYSPLDVPTIASHQYQVTINNQTVPVDYDDDQSTWLAVLLLSPSDLSNQDPSKQIVQGTVLDLIPSSLTGANPGGSPIAGNLSSNGYSIFSYLFESKYSSQATKPIDPDIGQSLSDTVQYIDLPCSLFNSICPSLTDLQMMAHVRAVQMKNKPIPANQTVDPIVSYSLVIGNRLPESMSQPSTDTTTPPLGTNVALLVSLECMEFALRGHTAGNYYDTKIASQPNGFVRVVVLYQWRFTSWQDTTFEFETMLKGLNGRDPSSPNSSNPLPNPQLRMPSPPVFPNGNDSQAIVQDMLASGYFPFNHITRLPLQTNPLDPINTVSWYRGPLVPYGAYVPAIQFLSSTDPSTATPVFYSSDQLLRFDPNIGMYDISYAAAWQLGQLLALYNQDFSTALYRWKKQVSMEYRMALEQDALADWFQNILSLATQAQLTQLRAFGKNLHSGLMRHLVKNNNE